MERQGNGTFAKGHIGWRKGTGWKNERRLCKCGKTFNPRKKTSTSCSQHCAMVGTKRRVGYKMPEKLKRHLSLKAKEQHRLGKISTLGYFKSGQTPSHTGKERPEVSGENHWNWRNGATNKNEKIRKSLKYKKWRSAVFKRDDWTCVFCGSRGGKLHADHIKRFADFPGLRFEITNGRTLCKPCHLKTDTYGTRRKK